MPVYALVTVLTLLAHCTQTPGAFSRGVRFRYRNRSNVAESSTACTLSREFSRLVLDTGTCHSHAQGWERRDHHRTITTTKANSSLGPVQL